MKPLRLLVIDDDVVDREAIRRLAKQAGWDLEVAMAVNAEEARQAVAATRFCCILLDYQLPGTDGLQLLAELQAACLPPVPVVMLTGEGNEMVAVQAMKQGASDYLPKALLTVDTLKRAVRQAIDRSRLEAELEQTRAQLAHQAHFDSLTGLGNRRLFMHDLSRSAAIAQRKKTLFCLLMMDLDDFKAANDLHGHEAGDAILAEVGPRLTSAGRASDSFYRLGGDEFTALIDGTGEGSLGPLLARITALVTAPIAWQGQLLRVSVSIGFAAFPEAGRTPDELLRAADAAMYEAKRLRHAGVAHSGQA